MSSLSTEVLKEKVLAEINAVRAEWMLDPLDELPKGLRGQRGECVVARALKDGLGAAMPNISGGKWDMVGPGVRLSPEGTPAADVVYKYPEVVWTYRPSDEAAEFIDRFDHEQVPELDAHKSKELVA